MGLRGALSTERRLGRIVLAGLVALLGLVVGAVLVFAAVALLEQVGVSVTAGLAVVLSAVLVQGIAFGAVSVLYLRIRGLGLTFVGLGVPDFRELLVVVSGYVLALTGAIAMVAVVVLAGLQPAQNRVAELGAVNPEVFLLLAVLSMLLIGPGEELLFRGIVQGTLRGVFSGPVAVLLATAIFALAHTTSLAGPLSGRALTVGLLFVPGLVLGAAYEYTDNIAVPALIHGGYNATLFVLAYASLAFGPGGPGAVG